jgi:hypothetical protein
MAKRIRLIQNQVAEIIKERTGLKRFLYGYDNKLPNNLLRAINDSGTATNCVRAIASFTQGEGFINEQTKVLKINKYQNANQFLYEIAQPTAIFEGFCLRILVNFSGEIQSIYKVGLKEIRREADSSKGDFRWNPRMGERDYRKDEDRFLKEFDPYLTPAQRAEALKQEMSNTGEQEGTIYYPFKTKEFDFGDIYPIPDANSGLEDIISDASLQRLEKRNITKGFKPNVSVAMGGKIDDQTKDENGFTESDYFDETLKAFIGDEASSVLILEGQTPEAMPQITVFPLSEMLDGVDKARLRVANAVCRHFGVPPVLVGLEAPTILGNAQAIYNSLKMFMLMIKSRQQLIIEAFNVLFPTYDFAIKQLNIYDYLPEAVLGSLTTDELRQLGGYPAQETKTSSSQELLINSLNSLSPLVANKVLESLSEEEIRGLVGLTGIKGGLPNATT